MTGETVQGYWFDGTQEYAARRRGEDFDRMRFATLESTGFSSPRPAQLLHPSTGQLHGDALLLGGLAEELDEL